ncbi:MAG: glycosyltransferase family 2 protein [Cypionkella sp.]
MKPSWAVVSTMDEPAPLVAAFAAHYLSIGASEVHIFLDQPDAEAEALLAGLPGVFVSVCDKAYWKQNKPFRRPVMHFSRQTRNANKVYQTTKCDWLLHCDADEFARDGAAIAEALAKAPEVALYMRLLVAERVSLAEEPQREIFDGVFRHGIKDFKEFGPQVYGVLCDFFRDGVTGHLAGKAFSRVGAGLEISLHAPRGRQPHRVIPKARLLHFDGLTRLHFMLKLLRRAHEPESDANLRHGNSRITQFESFRESVRDIEHREALVTLLKEINAEQADLLEGHGVLERARFDPRPALAAYGLTVDLSVEAFDAALKLRHGAFLREVAPDLLEEI